jgi:beta-mannanase
MEPADAVKALCGGLLIRYNWEMDQPPGARQHLGSPTGFVRAWRHIVSILRSRGATNAAFVWAPRAAAWKQNVATSFYPGNRYVDWIGASAVPTGSWSSFSTLVTPFYTWAKAQNRPRLVWGGVREDASSAVEG